MNADRFKQRYAIDACRNHAGVGAETAFLDAKADASAFRTDGVNRAVEMEYDTHFLRDVAQLAGEERAIAALVLRQMQRGGQRRMVGKRGLDCARRSGIDHAMLDTAAGLQVQRGLRHLQLLLAAEQLQHALGLLVLQLVVITQLLQNMLAVSSQPLHALLIDLKALEFAFR